MEHPVTQLAAIFWTTFSFTKCTKSLNFQLFLFFFFNNDCFLFLNFRRRPFLFLQCFLFFHNSWQFWLNNFKLFDVQFVEPPRRLFHFLKPVIRNFSVFSVKFPWTCYCFQKWLQFFFILGVKMCHWYFFLDKAKEHLICFDHQCTLFGNLREFFHVIFYPFDKFLERRLDVFEGNLPKIRIVNVDVFIVRSNFCFGKLVLIGCVFNRSCGLLQDFFNRGIFNAELFLFIFVFYEG